MKQLDKKQIPQFIALCVLTAGVSGYLVVRLVAPAPVSAGTRVPAASAVAPAAGQDAALPGKPGAPAQPGASDTADAPPPSPNMHDPFTVGYTEPAALPAAALAVVPKAPVLPPPGKQTANTGGIGPLPVAFPGAPPLPGALSGFPARPAAEGTSALASLPPAPAAPALPPAAPQWTVTGVLEGAGGEVAILRSGEARRIVRSGDFVDSTFRVVGVTRTFVVLRHGALVYHLTLGGAKAEPGAMPSALPAAPRPAERPAAMLGSAVLDGTLVPMYHSARPHAPLAGLKKQQTRLALTAEALSVPRPAALQSAAKQSPAKPASPAKVAGALSLGLRLLDGSVLAPRKE